MEHFGVRNRLEQRLKFFRTLLVVSSILVSGLFAVGVYFVWDQSTCLPVNSFSEFSGISSLNFLCTPGAGKYLANVVFFVGILAHYVAYVRSMRAFRTSESQFILERLGAFEFEPQLQTPAYLRMRALLESCCLAGGYGIPRFFLLPRENGINAMMIAPNQYQSYFLFTQGAVDKLSDDEKLSLMTHFLGNLLHNRVQLLTNMYFEIKMLTWSFYVWKEWKGSKSVPKVLLSPLLIPHAFLSFYICHALRSKFLHDSYLLADKAGCYFYERPVQLSSIFAKILMDSDYLGKLQYADATGLAHLFFVNPLKASFLQTDSLFPNLIQRIKFTGIVPQGLRGTSMQVASALSSGGGSDVPRNATDTYQKGAVPTEKYFLPEQWVGRIHEAGFLETRLFLDSLDAGFYQHIHTPEGGFWLCEQVFGVIRQVQNTKETASVFVSSLAGMTLSHKRILIEISISSLRRLTSIDRRTVVVMLWEKIQNSGIFNCYDLVLFFNLRSSLLPWYQRSSGALADEVTLTSSLELVFSYLSWLVLGNRPKLPEEAAFLFSLAAAELKSRSALPADVTFRPLNSLSPILFVDTLEMFRYLDPRLRESVFHGLRSLVFGSEGDYEDSWELLRLLGATLEIVIASSPKVIESTDVKFELEKP